MYKFEIKYIGLNEIIVETIDAEDYVVDSKGIFFHESLGSGKPARKYIPASRIITINLVEDCCDEC